jgi:hypothetical protein
MPVLGRMYTRRQLNEFVAVCHAIAVGAVRTRVRTLRFLTRFSFANDADVAYECISDLFRQDEKGTILQVVAYFEGIDCTHATDQELLIHLRRLVFSKVNYGLFRLLNEADPALGKILRNTRLACQTLQNFDIIERFGDPCLVPAMCDPLEHLPVLDPIEIERELHRVAQRSEHIPGLLSRLSLFLREQSSWSRVVPLMAFALAVRSFYEDRSVPKRDAVEEPDSLLAGEVTSLIEAACIRVRGQVEHKYVGVGKVSEKDFESYFRVIRELLIDRFVHHDGDSRSLFTRLGNELSALTKEKYFEMHRSRLEYLARLTENLVTRDLRKQV